MLGLAWAWIYRWVMEEKEKAMATHSSTLAWKIPWTEEPGRLQSMGSLRHDWAYSFTFHFHALEKEMATHSSVLAWSIPGTGEPSGLPSMGSHIVGHDWSDLAVLEYRLNLVTHSEWPEHGNGTLVTDTGDPGRPRTAKCLSTNNGWGWGWGLYQFLYIKIKKIYLTL